MAEENLAELLEELIKVDRRAIKEIRNLKKRVKRDKDFKPSYIV